MLRVKRAIFKRNLTLTIIVFKYNLLDFLIIFVGIYDAVFLFK